MVLRDTRCVPGILAEEVLASHHHTHVYKYGNSDFLHTEYSGTGPGPGGASPPRTWGPGARVQGPLGSLGADGKNVGEDRVGRH